MNRPSRKEHERFSVWANHKSMRQSLSDQNPCFVFASTMDPYHKKNNMWNSSQPVRETGHESRWFQAVCQSCFLQHMHTWLRVSTKPEGSLRIPESFINWLLCGLLSDLKAGMDPSFPSQRPGRAVLGCLPIVKKNGWPPFGSPFPTNPKGPQKTSCRCGSRSGCYWFSSHVLLWFIRFGRGDTPVQAHTPLISAGHASSPRTTMQRPTFRSELTCVSPNLLYPPWTCAGESPGVCGKIRKFEASTKLTIDYWTC